MFALFLVLPSCGFAGSILDTLCGMADMEGAYSAEIGLTFHSCVPFDANRLKLLNDLLQHVSFQLFRNDPLSSVKIRIGEYEALHWTEKKEDNEYQTVFSLDPDAAWCTQESLFSQEGLLHSSTPSMLNPDTWSAEDLLPFPVTRDTLLVPQSARLLLECLPGLFPEKIKESKIRVKVDEDETATRKMELVLAPDGSDPGTIPMIPDTISNPVLKNTLADLVFFGKQRFTFYLNEEGKLLKAVFTGQTGEKTERRKVDFSWTACTENDSIVHQISWNSKAVSGREKETLSALIEETDPRKNLTSDSLKVNWEYARSERQLQTTWTGAVQLQLNSVFSGTIQIGKTVGDQSRVVLIEPELEIASPGRWSGTIRWKEEENRFIQEDAEIHLSVTDQADIPWPAPSGEFHPDQMNEEEREWFLQAWNKRLGASVLRALLSLPDGSLGFINGELEKEAWMMVLSHVGLN